MKLRVVCVLALLSLVLSLVAGTVAQTASPASSALPRLVRFAGTAKDVNGNPLNGVVGITFALYSEQTGGAPLWVETQNVSADNSGHYLALLGSTKAEGLPTELFTTEQARWVGIQVSGQAEQPRVLLVSAPYALKAVDAETLAGLPASAFMRTTASPNTAVSQPSNAAAGSTGSTSPSATALASVTGAGTKSFIPIWTSASALGNSQLFQSAAGNVGLGTTAPTERFEVDSGNLLAKGPNNFKKAGDTAFLYVGDTNHPIEAIWSGGLAIGAFKAPKAIFVADYTGLVGIGTTAPTAGALNTVATTASVVGLSVVGYNALAGSNLPGSDGIHVSGGNADPAEIGSGEFLNGGNGMVITGGTGGIGSDPYTPNGGSGGAGLVVTGGAGGSSSVGNNNGGAGLVATGGNEGFIGAGGPGGIFTGGTGEYGEGNAGATFTGGVCTVIGAYCVGPDGIDSTSGGLGGYAGNFLGDINVSGAIYAGTKDFKIDHPLDPANKYLFHASVESSEMMNIYTGNVVLDGDGQATIQLPSWFEALNGDFRYQLTAIGRPSPGLYVAQEISGNHFQIAGGAPNAKVSWQVTAVRHDAYAKANPLVVEQEKSAKLRGHYIHPELFDQPLEKGIESVRNPSWMRHVQEVQAKAQQLRAEKPTTAQPR